MKPLLSIIFILLFTKVRCRDATCCTRMANETMSALAVFKECMIEKAERFASMNDGDCPPSCMVAMFSEQCIEEANNATADPIEILLSTNFENELNFTTTTGGDCPMSTVIDMISENQHHINKWFQIFCICMRCKIKGRTNSNTPSEHEVIIYIQDCYRKSKAICPQRILADQRAFSVAILGGAKRNVPCCWKVAETGTPANTETPVRTVAARTTPGITFGPTTTPLTTVFPATAPSTTVAPTSPPATTEAMTTMPLTTVAPTTVITTPITCVGYLNYLCNAFSDGTRAFLVDYRKCISERDDQYKTENGVLCSDQNAVFIFSSECFDNVSSTEKDSVTDYAQGERVFFKRINSTIAASYCPGNPPADGLIQKARDYETVLMSWFEYFCDCMNNRMREIYQNTGNCSTPEMNQIIRNCYGNATTKNIYKAFLPGEGAFSNLYEDYLFGNG